MRLRAALLTRLRCPLCPPNCEGICLLLQQSMAFYSALVPSFHHTQHSSSGHHRIPASRPAVNAGLLKYILDQTPASAVYLFCAMLHGWRCQARLACSDVTPWRRSGTAELAISLYGLACKVDLVRA